MKIKRFVAADMRAALIQVKEELGADAVILSNKKTPTGVEIVAAMDYDAQVLEKRQALQKKQIATESQVKLDKTKSKQADTNHELVNTNKSNNKATSSPEIDSISALLERQQQRTNQKSAITNISNDHSSNKNEAALPSWAQGLTKNTQSQQDGIKNNRINHIDSISNKASLSKTKNTELSEMKQEIASLRSLLVHQMSSLVTQDKRRRDPIRETLETRFIQGGFSPIIANKLASLTKKYNPVELAKVLPKILANSIASKKDEIISKGGIVSLIGPTGVGKTTTLAKLAARFIQKFNAEDLLLLTTDHYRIGAFEQLNIYAKIMGCQIEKLSEDDDLHNMLYKFRHKKLVLIDTPGMGLKDQRLYHQLDMLNSNANIPIFNYLVLAATSEQQGVADAVRHFKRVPLKGTIITKLDETMSLAGILSVLIHNHLKVSYTTNGQRVPEDLQIADPLSLIHHALEAINNKNNTLTQSLWTGELTHAAE